MGGRSRHGFDRTPNIGGTATGGAQVKLARTREVNSVVDSKSMRIESSDLDISNLRSYCNEINMYFSKKKLYGWFTKRVFKHILPTSEVQREQSVANCIPAKE